MVSDIDESSVGFIPLMKKIIIINIFILTRKESQPFRQKYVSGTPSK